MSAPEIHETAIVSSKAELGNHVKIGAYSIVESGAILSDNVKLHAHTYICGTTILGKDCEVYPYAVLGMPPQDTKYKGEETKLRIGTGTVIREHVTMHPGTDVGRAETIVGSNSMFMIGSHVAHDCVVGDHVVFANNAALAGYVTVGDGCILGGYTTVVQYTRIGNYAILGAMAKVNGDVIPYGAVQGNIAHLSGLNIIGLKRRKIPRQKIHNLRSAYRLLFADEGTFNERLRDVTEAFSDSQEVMEIVTFIRTASTRSLCMPHARSS